MYLKSSFNNLSKYNKELLHEQDNIITEKRIE